MLRLVGFFVGVLVLMSLLRQLPGIGFLFHNFFAFMLLASMFLAAMFLRLFFNLSMVMTSVFMS